MVELQNPLKETQKDSRLAPLIDAGLMQPLLLPDEKQVTLADTELTDDVRSLMVGLSERGDKASLYTNGAVGGGVPSQEIFDFLLPFGVVVLLSPREDGGKYGILSDPVKMQALISNQVYDAVIAKPYLLERTKDGTLPNLASAVVSLSEGFARQDVALPIAFTSQSLLLAAAVAGAKSESELKAISGCACHYPKLVDYIVRVAFRKGRDHNVAGAAVVSLIFIEDIMKMSVPFSSDEDGRFGERFHQRVQECLQRRLWKPLPAIAAFLSTNPKFFEHLEKAERSIRFREFCKGLGAGYYDFINMLVVGGEEVAELYLNLMATADDESLRNNRIVPLPTTLADCTNQPRMLQVAIVCQLQRCIADYEEFEFAREAITKLKEHALLTSTTAFCDQHTLPAKLEDVRRDMIENCVEICPGMITPMQFCLGEASMHLTQEQHKTAFLRQILKHPAIAYKKDVLHVVKGVMAGDFKDAFVDSCCLIVSRWTKAAEGGLDKSSSDNAWLRKLLVGVREQCAKLASGVKCPVSGVQALQLKQYLHVPSSPECRNHHLAGLLALSSPNTQHALVVQATPRTLAVGGVHLLVDEEAKRAQRTKATENIQKTRNSTMAVASPTTKRKSITTNSSASASKLQRVSSPRLSSSEKPPSREEDGIPNASRAGRVADHQAETSLAIKAVSSIAASVRLATQLSDRQRMASALRSICCAEIHQRELRMADVLSYSLAVDADDASTLWRRFAECTASCSMCGRSLLFSSAPLSPRRMVCLSCVNMTRLPCVLTYHVGDASLRALLLLAESLDATDDQAGGGSGGGNDESISGAIGGSYADGQRRQSLRKRRDGRGDSM